MQAIDLIWMTVMFMLMAFWIGRVEKKLDRVLSMPAKLVNVQAPDVFCPKCSGVNSIVPCDLTVDGINHKGLDTKQCVVCGTMLITDSTKYEIDTMVNDTDYMCSIVLKHVKDKVFSCPNPTFEILQAFNKLSRNKRVLSDYSSDVVRKALLRDEESMFDRVYLEISMELKTGFPQCFIEVLEEEEEEA